MLVLNYYVSRLAEIMQNSITVKNFIINVIIFKDILGEEGNSEESETPEAIVKVEEISEIEM